MRNSTILAILFSALFAGAESEPFNSYTNHAGNVIAGWPVNLTATHVTLAARTLPTTNYQLTTTYPLSIFPESERRRIAADFVLRQQPSWSYGTINGSGSPGTVRPTDGDVGLLRVPVAVKRAITGAEKAMARSRKRAEKGLCTKEESDAFCAKSESALRSYLDKQVKEGIITPAERKALRR